MKALIIGASGATGKDLVQVLLQDARYTAVVIFVRRSTGLVHPKLTEVLTDFNDIEQVSGQINGEVLFSCLGTTLKAAGSKDKQRQIDYAIPFQFAEIAKHNGVPSIVLLSAYGASATSSVFYSRIKGELEDGITKLAFPQCIIFRPGLLVRENSDRLGERISAGVLNFLNSIGLLKKFKPLPTATLAGKMAKASNAFTDGLHIVELNKIFGL